MSAFTDAGNASCSAAFRAQFQRCVDQGTNPLLSAGAELGADLAFLSFFTTRARFGVAGPISGPATRPFVYVSFGPSF
jgi:hypothetical protein